MNFFEHQDRARQNTQKLVGLFILSVLCIITAVYGAVLLIFGLTAPGSQSLWDPELWLLVAVPTTLIIGGGSWFKLLQLQQGGRVIAQDLGGRLLISETANPAEKQLLNVVEEMAIAANIPVPAVYLLDREEGINAFAAGHTVKNAVIGVTRGSLNQLDRDELQGVIGHEFSHILNGDMRLNLRLVGLLHGILLIYLTGRVLFDWGPNYDSRNEKGNALVWFGLALIAIGSLGLVCGRLIQSAVSRQREFLADASAVQFTRNPSGISQALRKIASHHQTSLIRSPYAESNSHLFFGSALRFNFFGNWFATHPSLDQRIRRIGVDQGQAITLSAGSTGNPQLTGNHPQVMGFASGGSQLTARSASATNLGTTVNAAGLMPKWLIALPEVVHSGIHHPQDAIALIYALTLNSDNPSLADQQIAWLRQLETAGVVDQMLQMRQSLQSLQPKLRLPLVDQMIPALQQLPVDQCLSLFKTLSGLVKVNGRWSLTDFGLYMVLWYRLQSHLKPSAPHSPQYETLEPIWADCILVLSAIAQLGQTSQENRVYTFRSGVSRLPGAGQYPLPDALPPCNFSELRKSLDRLREASPKLKKAIADACAYTVWLDNVVSVQEADLLRVLAIALDCPFPPFLKVG